MDNETLIEIAGEQTVSVYRGGMDRLNCDVAGQPIRPSHILNDAVARINPGGRATSIYRRGADYTADHVVIVVAVAGEQALVAGQYGLASIPAAELTAIEVA